MWRALTLFYAVNLIALQTGRLAAARLHAGYFLFSIVTYACFLFTER